MYVCKILFLNFIRGLEEKEWLGFGSKGNNLTDSGSWLVFLHVLMYNIYFGYRTFNEGCVNIFCMITDWGKDVISVILIKNNQKKFLNRYELFVFFHL